LDRGKWKAPAPTTTLTIRTAQEALRALIQRIEKSGLALTFNPDRGGSMYSDHDAPLNEEALARGELAVTLSPSRRSAASSESPVVGAPQP
jgi:hypothetical protein